MNSSFLHKILSFFALIAISTSCSSNLDFNQKMGDLSPYFEVKDIFNAEVFNNSNAQNLTGNPSVYPLSSQTIPFDINEKLTDNGIVQNLKEVTFHMTLTNTTNNECSIKVIFRNGSVPLTKFTTDVIVPANESKPKEITFLESDIPNLKSVTNLQFTGFMTLTGAKLPSGTLSVNSDATIYLKL